MNQTMKLMTTTLAAALFAVGCSKSSNSGGGAATADSSLTISGLLSLSGSSVDSASTLSANAKLSNKSAPRRKANAFATTDYKVACATFESVPKACGSTVATDGSFSLSCDGYKGVPFGCFVFNTVSFKNYPITFNITSGTDTSESSTVNVNGNLTSVSIAVDTDTGLATAAATVADPAAINEIAVDASAVSAFDGTWMMTAKTYAEVASKYSADDLLGVKLLACFKTYWQSCNGGGSNCGPDAAKAHCLTTAPTMDNAVAYDAMIQERLGTGFPLFMATSTDGSDYFLNVWQSSAHKAACGNIETGFTWKFSDGVGGKADVDLDFSTATGCDGKTANQCLVDKTSAGILTVVENWFPFLKGDVDGTQAAPTVTVSCKYMYDLWGDFWNPNQAMIDACSANTGGISCSSGGDPMQATRNYVMKGIYSGADMSADAVFMAGMFSPDANFSNSVVAESAAAVGYGYRTWDQNGETWTVLTNPTRTDIGGCLQWPDWGKCQTDAASCSGPQYPTVVPVGKDVYNYGPNGAATDDDNKWKCSFSEKRMLVANTNGYIDIDGTKYFEAQPFITLNADSTQAKHESWSKVCDVANGSEHSYQTYPFDMDSTQIATEAANRAGGGSPEQKKGIYMQAIYEMLTSEGHGGGGGGNNMQFFTGNRSISCNEIKAGAATTGATLTWNEVQKAFDYSFGPWQLGQLMKCVMLGMAAHHNTGEMYEAAYAALPTGVGATFADDGNGQPTIFSTLQSNSCVPKFQMTHMCTTDGFCSPRVICDDYNADDGGCVSKAQPASRMAHMKVEALPESKYRFFNVENRFDVMFNPSTNSNTVCQRAEYMSITTETPVTSSSTSVDMTFESTSAEKNVSNPDADCQGNALGNSSKLEMPDPKMYTTFTKQQ